MFEIFPKEIDPVQVELEFKMLIRAFLAVAKDELAREREEAEKSAGFKNASNHPVTRKHLTAS